MPLITSNGIDISYNSVGKGPSIVFIHGGYGGASTTVMAREERWVDELKDSYNVVTYDRRSSGQSSYPDSKHSLDIFVEDLNGLVTGLGFSKIFLIGSSAGGPISIKYSVKYPESVAGLILANTSVRVWAHKGRATAAEELAKRIDILKQKGPEEAFDILDADDLDVKPFHLIGQKPNPKPPGFDENQSLLLKQLHASLNRENKVKYFAGELRNQAAYLDVDLTDYLKSIKIPSLIIHGDLDTQVPYDLGKELSELIEGSEFVTVPGAGHGIMQWPKAALAIREFCDKLQNGRNLS